MITQAGRRDCIAGQVIQCVDGTAEVNTEYYIDRTPYIRSYRKLELRMANLADYAQDNPDLVIRRPIGDSRRFSG